MSATLERLPNVGSLPVRLGWQWFVEGARIWRRHPLKLFLICLAPMAAEALLQLIPWAGVTLSKILPLWLGLGILSGLAESEQTGVLRWSCLFEIFHQRRWRSLVLLAVMFGPLVFGVQQLVAWMVYGWPAVDAVLLGHVSAHPELMTRAFQWLLILPGVPVSVLLGLAPMYWLFAHVSAWAAIRESARTVLRHPWPFGLYTLIQLAVLTLILTGSLAMLLLLPYLAWGTASSYAMWKDIRGMAPGVAVA